MPSRAKIDDATTAPMPAAAARAPSVDWASSSSDMRIVE